MADDNIARTRATVADLVADVETLASEVERLRHVCAEAYQFAGTVGAPQRVLDMLWAAAQGTPLPQESFLPVALEDCDPLPSQR